jgi:hypothetical protein
MKTTPLWAAGVLLAALALLAPLSGCAGTREKGDWASAHVTAGSDRLMWQVTIFALEKEGFPVTTQVDPGALVATTGWRTDLSPFRGQGHRERAEVRSVQTAPGNYEVRVRVERQVNMDIVQPLDLRFAKWEPAADNTEAAAVLLQRIRAWAETGTRQAGEPAKAGG